MVKLFENFLIDLNAFFSTYIFQLVSVSFDSDFCSVLLRSSQQNLSEIQKNIMCFALLHGTYGVFVGVRYEIMVRIAYTEHTRHIAGETYRLHGINLGRPFLLWENSFLRTR